MIVDGTVSPPGHLTIAGGAVTRYSFAEMQLVHTYIRLQSASDMSKIALPKSISVAGVAGPTSDGAEMRLSGLASQGSGGFAAVQVDGSNGYRDFDLYNAHITGIQTDIEQP